MEIKITQVREEYFGNSVAKPHGDQHTSPSYEHGPSLNQVATKLTNPPGIGRNTS